MISCHHILTTFKQEFRSRSKNPKNVEFDISFHDFSMNFLKTSRLIQFISSYLYFRQENYKADPEDPKKSHVVVGEKGDYANWVK